MLRSLLNKIHYLSKIKKLHDLSCQFSQRKYAHDILDETRLLGSCLIGLLMDPNQKLLRDNRDLFSYPNLYFRLVGKLNYLTSIRLDISYTYTVSVVSKFLEGPRFSH